MIFKNRNLYFVIIALLLLDVVYSFLQHYSVGLDGDLSVIVMPSDWYSTVLKDPFGLNVLFNNEVYAAPNRFFVHWTMGAYFKNVPLWLQRFLNPIDSVYAACAIAKMAIQLGIIAVLSVYITRLTKKSGVQSFLLAAILIVPLFQTNGYNVMIGIIDKSITYTFFYAATLLALLIFYLPFCITDWTKTKAFGWGTHFILLLLLLALPFSGPLIPGVVLIVCPSVLCYFWWKGYNSESQTNVLKRFVNGLIAVPGPILFYFILISILSLYSLYVGTHNAENLGTTISLSERFSRIPTGIVNLLINKLGLPLLLIMIGVNVFLLRKYCPDDPEARKIRMVLKLIGIFALIYILLLPLGGYRSYRPNILRRDTILPITLSLFFLYGWSTYYLLHHILPALQKKYIAGVIVFLCMFTIADNSGFGENQCERKQLERLSTTSEKVVLLESDCYVMSWENILNYQHSEWNCKLLRHWKILKEEKYYYQK